MLLLTTPDYPPKLGGLASHTLNVEKVLKELGVAYEVFQWNNYREIMTFPKERLSKFDTILNIHSGFHMHMPESEAKVINFVNGAEILFYSPNPLKNLVKKLTRKRGLQRMEGAHYNIFISEFTRRTLVGKGLVPDYSRDVIQHMVVDTRGQRKVLKDWSTGPLKFICVARDVPHKNFAGALAFCELIREISGRDVEFITVTNREFHSDKIKVRSYVNPDNQKRDELLSEAHVNVLFSLDHSHKGFFEGFGQIVQEAGCFATPSLVLGTGGLSESVHHGETGWVLNDLTALSVKRWWAGMSSAEYLRVSEACYEHTLSSHGLSEWTSLFRVLLK